MESPETKTTQAISSDKSFELLLGVSVESLKMFFDTMKHLTTLSAGAFLILAALINKTSGAGYPLLAIGFGCLATSICFAMFCMFQITVAMKGSFELDKGMTKLVQTFAFTMAVAILSFVLGLAAIAVSMLLCRA